MLMHSKNSAPPLATAKRSSPYGTQRRARAVPRVMNRARALGVLIACCRLWLETQASSAVSRQCRGEMKMPMRGVFARRGYRVGVRCPPKREVRSCVTSDGGALPGGGRGAPALSQSSNATCVRKSDIETGNQADVVLFDVLA